MRFLILVYLSSVKSFLLEPDQAANSSVDNKFLSMNTFLNEKKAIQHEIGGLEFKISQVQYDTDQALQVLTSQLQKKLSSMEEKLKSLEDKNETDSSFSVLEGKYKELLQNYTDLEQRYLNTEHKCNSEITILQKKTDDLTKNLSDIQKASSVSQSFDLLSIQHQLQKISLLENNQNARNQDFLALYNQTLAAERNIQNLNLETTKKFEMFAKYQNSSIEDVRTQLMSVSNNFRNFSNDQILKMSDVHSKLNDIERNVSSNSEKVAITGCTASDTTYANSPVKFTDIMTYTGIAKTASFQSSGKFICEKPGLYYISAYIRSGTNNHSFYLKKNNKIVSRSATTYWPSSVGYSTSSINAVVEVEVNDTVYIETSGGINVQYYSCLTIVKIK